MSVFRGSTARDGEHVYLLEGVCGTQVQHSLFANTGPLNTPRLTVGALLAYWRAVHISRVVVVVVALNHTATW